VIGLDLFSMDMASFAGLAAALLGAGVAAGFLAGLLGVGGGIVVVPVLFHLFAGMGYTTALSMNLAVGTSLAIIIPTAVASMSAHHRHGKMDLALLRRWGTPVFLGAVAGTAVAGTVGGEVLVFVFSCTALALAVYLGVSHGDPSPVGEMPGEPLRAFLGGAIGCLSVMMGIGGGSLSVPVMRLFGFSIHRAVGTAAALGLIIALPGAAGFALEGSGAPQLPPLSLGYINLPGVALIFPVAVCVAPLGARAAHRLERGHLQKGFALFLAVSAILMLLRVPG
jgi:uncharacterized membrane protein YfcA